MLWHLWRFQWGGGRWGFLFLGWTTGKSLTKMLKVQSIVLMAAWFLEVEPSKWSKTQDIFWNDLLTQLFTAFLSAPRGSFTATRLSQAPDSSLSPGSRKQRGRLRGLVRSPGGVRAARPRLAFQLARAATGEARPGSSYTVAGSAPALCALRGCELAEVGPGGGGGGAAAALRATARRREVFPHGGAATSAGEVPEGNRVFLPLRRAGVGRTHPDHEGQQRHREPGFRRLQPGHPAPFVCIALSRRSLWLGHQIPDTEFEAPGTSGAPEVTGATPAFRGSPCLPRAVQARVAAGAGGGTLRVWEFTTAESPALQHAPGLSAVLLPSGPHAR